jgi:hypothetical protein
MIPVVGSTNRRGNFRTGAEMISDASRRSTAAFAPPGSEEGSGVIAGRDADAADLSGPTDVVGVVGKVEEPWPSVTTRRAARSCEDAPLPAPATRSAAIRPFARRLSISTAGRSRLREKSARSRHSGPRGAAASVGAGSVSTTRRSVATFAIAASSARSTRRARSRRASSGSTRRSSGLTGSGSKTSLSKVATSQDACEDAHEIQALRLKALAPLPEVIRIRRTAELTNSEADRADAGDLALRNAQPERLDPPDRPCGSRRQRRTLPAPRSQALAPSACLAPRTRGNTTSGAASSSPARARRRACRSAAAGSCCDASGRIQVRLRDST